MRIDLTTVLIFCAIFYLMGMSTCNCYNKKSGGQQVGKSDTVRQTIVVPIALDVPVYVPKPYAVVQERVIGKTSLVYRDREVNARVDTAEILKDYYASAYYLDSVATGYGNIFISDTVSRNRIAARSVRSDLNIPVTSTTVTNTVAAKRKNEFWYGLGGHYNGDLYGGGSIMFLHKKGFGLELGSSFGTSKKALHSVSIKRKF